MRGSRIPALILTVAVAAVTAACGGSTPSTTSTTLAHVSDPSPAGTFGSEPAIAYPVGRPPTHLEVSDLIAGSGPAAKKGDMLTVQYVGSSYSTESEFAKSWGGKPFTFKLGATGAGSVIKGWDEGLVGMRAGGRRELVIPPALAYGNSSPPGSGIPPDETLIFVIDLIKIT